MVEIKNVAIVGASGNLGAPVLTALIDANKFNITVVSRIGSKSTFPSGIKVVYADYSSLGSLTDAFKGQDAVISTVGADGLLGQSLLFDAASTAGVKRFIPSEFGSDTSNPLTATLPVFGYKVATRRHIEAKVAAGAKTTYTYVITGGFLDMGLIAGFLLAWQDGKPKLYDGGDNLFSATTLTSIGLAIVGVLTHYDETVNRSVYVEDFQTSQKQLLEIAKKALPTKTFEPVTEVLANVKKTSDEALAKGDYSMRTMLGYIFLSIFGGEAYGMPFKKNDNELLGVPGMTEADVEALFKKYAR